MGKVLDTRGMRVENLPDSYDNIDEQGNVLYLDEERLRRKVNPNKLLWKNRPNGLGIKNFIVTHVSARSWNWGLILALFKKLVAWSVFMQKPGSMGDTLYRRAMYFTPPDQTHSMGVVLNLLVDSDAEGDTPACAGTGAETGSGTGIAAEAGTGVAAEAGTGVEAAGEAQAPAHLNVPINKDLTEEAQRITVPMDLVKKAISEAHFIGGMKTCLCRAGQGCTDYPHDLACLFFNRSGTVVVDHGMAVELTKEEAFARVDRAAELGLTCQSLWVQVEQLIWGFRNDEMDSFLEICFCCPCCCVGFNISNNSPRDVKKHFGPSGWTSVVNHDLCTGCKHCLDTYCPQDAIHFRESDGKMVVDQENCVGCGFCRKNCPSGAIKIKQTMPMRASVHDYFLEEGKIQIVSGKGYGD